MKKQLKIRIELLRLNTFGPFQHIKALSKAHSY